MEDVKEIKSVLSKANLLVRINPIYEGSQTEINNVIEGGANMVMLPFYKTKDEASLFLRLVNGRVRTCLLCETSEAVECMDEILTLDGIDCIFIGLNDLHLSYKMEFMFELLANGTVEMLCQKFKNRGIQYGFGGIAQIGQGDLPSEYVISEHYWLGSNMCILSRSFCNANKAADLNEISTIFETGVKTIRKFENSLLDREQSYFELNHETVQRRVIEIVNRKKEQDKE